jgi:hypothetical protein
MKISNVSMAVLAMVILLLTGCGTMGPYVGYVAATDEDATRVANGGFSEEAVAQIAIVQNPRINGGKLSVEALKEIQFLSMSCQGQVGAQAAGPLQAVGTGVVIGSVAGGVGTGTAAQAAYLKNNTGVSNFARFGLFGLIAGGVNGAVNGYATGSYNLAVGIGSCTTQFWADALKADAKGVFQGTKIVTLPYGKRVGGSLPPALSPADREMVLKNSQQ